MLWVLSKSAQRGHVELEARGGGDVEARPGDRDGPQDMAVCKREHASAGRLAQADELGGPGIDLSRRLAAGAAVLVELPARVHLVDLLCGKALVVAVIELAKGV